MRAMTPAPRSSYVSIGIPAAPHTGMSVVAVDCREELEVSEALVAVPVEIVVEDLVVDDEAASDITETVLDPLLATKTSPFPESYAIPIGPNPTSTLATTALV